MGTQQYADARLSVEHMVIATQIVPARLRHVCALALCFGLLALSAQSQQKPVVDVRYVSGETRMLEDDEYSALRAGLHYVPESVQLSKGGNAVTQLVDSEGRVLATYMVQWVRTVHPVVGSKPGAGGNRINRYGTPVGIFHVAMKNLSTCQWSPSASLNDPTGAFDAANSILNGPTVSVYSPGPGRMAAVNTKADLSDDYAVLMLTPKAPEYALTQCRTKGLQQQPTSASCSGFHTKFTWATYNMNYDDTVNVKDEVLYLHMFEPRNDPTKVNPLTGQAPPSWYDKQYPLATLDLDSAIRDEDRYNPTHISMTGTDQISGYRNSASLYFPDRQSAERGLACLQAAVKSVKK